MIKRFYFIRHGQTFLNAQKIKQGAEGGLNEAGKKQADTLGQIFAGMKKEIKAIFSSPYERAKETAEIINSHLNVPITYTPLLSERRNPSEVIGKGVNDPEVERITAMIEKGFHSNTYRYSDEENFVDLIQRADECLKYLEKNGVNATCVITHHAFLQVMLSYMMYRANLDAGSYVKLAYFNPADNGGITVCEYNSWKRWSPSKGWKILSYNQHAES